jgi:hypothetical protein
VCVFVCLCACECVFVCVCVDLCEWYAVGLCLAVERSLLHLEWFFFLITLCWCLAYFFPLLPFLSCVALEDVDSQDETHLSVRKGDSLVFLEQASSWIHVCASEEFMSRKGEVTESIGGWIHHSKVCRVRDASDTGARSPFGPLIPRPTKSKSGGSSKKQSRRKSKRPSSSSSSSSSKTTKAAAALQVGGRSEADECNKRNNEDDDGDDGAEDVCDEEDVYDESDDDQDDGGVHWQGESPMSTRALDADALLELVHRVQEMAVSEEAEHCEDTAAQTISLPTLAVSTAQSPRRHVVLERVHCEPEGGVDKRSTLKRMVHIVVCYVYMCLFCFLLAVVCLCVGVCMCVCVCVCVCVFGVCAGSTTCVE